MSEIFPIEKIAQTFGPVPLNNALTTRQLTDGNGKGNDDFINYLVKATEREFIYATQSRRIVRNSYLKLNM